MLKNYTERATYSIRRAEEESRKMRHNYIGTGMILLGILEEGGAASRLLNSFGITYAAAHEELEALIGRGSGNLAADIPFSPNAQEALVFARKEAESREIKDVAVPHLLYALLHGKDSMAMRVFDVMGINFDVVRAKVAEELDKNYGSRT